jgi:hypothetical protein
MIRGAQAVIAAALSPLLTGCDQAPWQGWVYPAASDLTDDIPIGHFESLEQCRASAKAILVRTNERQGEDGSSMTGDYECGFKCKPDGGLGGLNVCEKTEK